MSRPQGPACDIGAYEKDAPVLSISKSVTPETAVAYRNLVTYTITISNTGIVSATNVQITDTLPGEVDFGHWLGLPAGVNVTNDVVTWAGLVPPDDEVTIPFVAILTRSCTDEVTNEVIYTHSTGNGGAEATFAVEKQCFIYLPLIAR